MKIREIALLAALGLVLTCLTTGRAHSADDLRTQLLGTWKLDREATRQKLAEEPAESEPLPLPDFETTLIFSKEGNVMTDTLIGEVSQKRGFRWRILEESPQLKARVEFLPTAGLPRRHDLQLLDDDRLSFRAQGAKHELIFVRMKPE
ncbi:MAG: hypothetical protein RIC55_12175 [Pirellulaceae bacterium]